MKNHVSFNEQTHLYGKAVKIVDFESSNKTKSLTVFLNRETMDCQISIFHYETKITYSAYLDRSILLYFARMCKEYIAQEGKDTLKFYDGTQGSTNFVRVGRSDKTIGHYLINIIKDIWHSDPESLDEITIEVPVTVIKTVLDCVFPPQT